MFCKNCGSPLDDNASFCGNCGAKISPESKKKHSPVKYVLLILALLLRWFEMPKKKYTWVCYQYHHTKPLLCRHHTFEYLSPAHLSTD